MRSTRGILHRIDTDITATFFRLGSAAAVFVTGSPSDQPAPEDERTELDSGSDFGRRGFPGPASEFAESLKYNNVHPPRSAIR